MIQNDILLCRPGFEEALCEEFNCKSQEEVRCTIMGSGVVEIGHESLVRLSCPLIFARQNLPAAGFIPDQELKPITVEQVNQMLEPAISSGEGWIVHALVSGAEDEGTLGRRIKGIEKAILRVVRDHFPKVYRVMDTPSGDVFVLQLCLTPKGLFSSCARLSSLVSASPGGVVRMYKDSRAPSRSYLKLEEAFILMGKQPQAGQIAVDLGAAPGGWTYSLLKRGCDVLAVDHGPMKLPPAESGWGTCEHIRENGITFEPDEEIRPVDWLVSDMLIAPGVALGLLRNWIGHEWMRYFVCNIKIPQHDPYSAVKPLEDFLCSQKRFSFRLQQLYHDRREITVMGSKV